MKIGVYGGSFNPVHKGHINLAKTALEKLNLDKLIIMPVGKPWYKEDNNIAEGLHRLNMCRLAFENEDKIEVSGYEVNKEGRSYTSTTIHWLKTLYPDDEIYLIMGSDMFFTLEKWHAFDELKSMVTFIAAARISDTQGDMEKYLRHLRKNDLKAEIMPMDILPISSTEIRENMEAMAEYLPEKILEYARQNGLYGFEIKNYTYPLEEFNKILKGRVEEKRYLHSLNVADTAEYLAEKYGYNTHIARTAGLLHDICKRISYEEQVSLIKKSHIAWDEATFKQEKILHGISGAEYLFYEMGVYNTDIISAIRYHTTGRPNMTLLEEIVYVSDLISVERDYPDVDKVREMADRDLKEAIAYISRYSLNKLIRNGAPISEITQKTYNYYCVKE